MCLLGASLLPLRSHMSVATSALVLVVPVIVGVSIGGFISGIAATAVGFLVYDFVFIPPYYTLTVGAAQNWAALGVYAVVMIIVSRVVSSLNSARAQAHLRAIEVQRLFDLSELLVRDTSIPEILDTIVNSVIQAFDLQGAALLMPEEGLLELVASAGTPLTELELDRLKSQSGLPVSLETALVEIGHVQAVPLEASSKAIGLLALRGIGGSKANHELLRAFVNHMALALERTQLREQAMRANLLEEVDVLRRSLVGAVSHDLRTPLATIKVSASALLDPDAPVDTEGAQELVGLIDIQADRLDRLVANLLDMTRIQSGALELRRKATSLTELIDESLAALGTSAGSPNIVRDIPFLLPAVDVDPVL
ncbi:MAG TPA: DUF4118 domain-containing protein, partial [Acidimicrobiales bacterium]|nr:DUF4118 domain-containing protein [Acidimicrobiales bacterium]